MDKLNVFSTGKKLLQVGEAGFDVAQLNVADFPDGGGGLIKL
jgi:hypothetical protein